ncbi:hypothetical protein CC86DRAFT_432236 [Ophiobolus disseminans]|uniref:Apple domain-containing protein n=1 Tax=Ophiobolus disseminans TaxID=1469910 RepID=A0A6A6ZE83_9PLEO|nr:hypothetical protein CC86DRAFT_432236 [Ophiobolus disseminans]
MLFIALLAVLSAVPTVFADTVTSAVTRCTTSFGYQPLSSGITVTTWYNKTTTTNYFNYTYTTRTVIFVTPSASTSTNIVTTTAVVSVTSASTPIPTTIPTPASFLPLFAYAPAATPVSRAKRNAFPASDHAIALQIFRRQTLANNTGGLSVSRDGKTSNIYRKYAHRVDCRITYTVNQTSTTIVTGLPETALVMSTVTVSRTTTAVEVKPRETRYAACLGNNVVNSVPGMTGEDIVFNCVIYRPSEGFPVENELVVNTTSAENCCIACQNTAYCAGSFFVPSELECHLRLTQAPALPQLPAPFSYGNGSSYAAYPTASNALATGTSPSTPISTAGPGTCSKSSLSLHLGTIQGQLNFPKEYALVFSNGRCGRYSVWPIPMDARLDTTRQDRKIKRLELE